jgi:flagellin-like protein
MKGISPLVAAVLLIAVTMSIAGVLAYWASQFVTKSLPGLNETTTQCRFTNFVIYNCLYNSSASQLTMTLNNIQTVEIKDLTVYLSFLNGSLSSGIKLNGTLAGGEFRSYVLSSISNDFSKVIVTTQICPDISKEDACKRS